LFRPSFIRAMKEPPASGQLHPRIVVLPEEIWSREIKRQEELGSSRPAIVLSGISTPVDLANPSVYPSRGSEELVSEVKLLAADHFSTSPIQRAVAAYALNYLAAHPTHVLDEEATLHAQDRAAELVPESRGKRSYVASQKIADRGEVTADEWRLL